MKTCIISYSFTGNNERLAKSLAQALETKHMAIRESKARNMYRIITDMIFSKTPSVEPAPEIIEDYDHVIFIGPIWMQQAASPLRAYFKWCRKHGQSYSFITVSGGALNDNPKLQANVRKLAGQHMTYYEDFHIAKLLSEGRVSPKETSNYQLTDEDIALLTQQVTRQLKAL